MAGPYLVTIPNLITILRFLLVPAVVLTMLQSRWGWAFTGFIVAGVSDAVDGFVARNFNQRSRLGAYLDPMADKVLLVSVFVVLGIIGELPLWLVVAAVSRDALIICAVLLSTVMGQPVEMRPLLVSKANTAIQIVLAARRPGGGAFLDGRRDGVHRDAHDAGHDQSGKYQGHVEAGGGRHHQVADAMLGRNGFRRDAADEGHGDRNLERSEEVRHGARQPDLAHDVQRPRAQRA